MDIKDGINFLVKHEKSEWKKHALQRILERNIKRSEVFEAILSGKIIESYLDDYPFSSFLIAFVATARPLHVLVGYRDNETHCHIITVYEPSTQYFKTDLVTRRKNENRQ